MTQESPKLIVKHTTKEMYNFTEGTTAHKGNEMGIFEDLGDVYAQEDLDAFFAAVYPYVLPCETGPTKLEQ